jgi:hypothetical protein
MPELTSFSSTHGIWSSSDGAPLPAELPALVDYLEVDCQNSIAWEVAGRTLAGRVASRATVEVRNFDAATLRRLVWPIAHANPTIIWDVLIEDALPPPAELRQLHAEWPHEIGYLDRVAVYHRPVPDPPWEKATPRFVLVLPWGMPLDPLRYEGTALVMWRLPRRPSATLLAEVAAYGGDGIVVEDGDAADLALEEWQQEHGLLLWRATPMSEQHVSA